MLPPPTMQTLDRLRLDRDTMRNIVAWERYPARAAQYAPWPAGLDPRLAAAERRRGIERLYTHQALAVEAALRGENVVVVTGTASGKTLGYNLPVLHALLADDQAARACTCSPPKPWRRTRPASWASSSTALAQAEGAPLPLAVRTYDGDTPQGAAQRHPQGGRGAHLQPRHAAHRHPAAPSALGRPVRQPEVRGAGRGPQLPRRLRLAHGQRAAAAAAHLRLLRLVAAVHLHLGHHRQPAGAGREAHRGARPRWCRPPPTARRGPKSTSWSTTRPSPTRRWDCAARTCWRPSAWPANSWPTRCRRLYLPAPAMPPRCC